VPPIENIIIEEVVERPLDVGGPYGARGQGNWPSWDCGIDRKCDLQCHRFKGEADSMTAEKVLEA